MIAPSQGRQPATATLHANARMALRSGKIARAKTLLRRCVFANRQDSRAWELFGEAHHLRRNFPLSYAAFRRAEKHGQLSAENAVRLAIACARLGRVQEAASRLTKLATDERVTAMQLLDVAMGLNSIGRTDRALHACRRAMQIDPDNAQASYDLGYYCDLAGYPPTTTESLMRRAVRCEPREPRYRIGLACLLARNERLNDAFLLVRDVGGTSLSAMTCSRSVELLISIYRDAGETRRLTICHQRLVELRLRGCGFGC